MKISYMVFSLAMLVGWPGANAIDLTPKMRAQDLCGTACSSHRWKEALKTANLEASRSVAGAVLSHWKVRLVFADGAWIEFKPSLLAVSDSALPPIVAMQFGAGERGHHRVSQER